MPYRTDHCYAPGFVAQSHPARRIAGDFPGRRLLVLSLGLAAYAIGGDKCLRAQVKQSSQVVLENKTKSTLDLKVDGQYACRALANLMCVTQVTPGFHALTASKHSRNITVKTGEIYTWTIP